MLRPSSIRTTSPGEMSFCAKTVRVEPAVSVGSMEVALDPRVTRRPPGVEARSLRSVASNYELFGTVSGQRNPFSRAQESARVSKVSSESALGFSYGSFSDGASSVVVGILVIMKRLAYMRAPFSAATVGNTSDLRELA